MKLKESLINLSKKKAMALNRPQCFYDSSHTPFMERRFWLLSISVLLLSGCLNQKSDFDPDRAWSHLEAQVAFGPRVPGSIAHENAKEYFMEEFKKYCDGVTIQPFTVLHGGKSYEMANIVCVFNPKVEKKILLAAHYDSRPYADRDSPENSQKPIPGANDGASGVSVLLEVARVLSQGNPKVSVVIVLFDGEDFGKTLEYYFLGSRYFTEHMDFTPEKAILIDMIGDKDLNIYYETNSYECCESLVEEVWGMASRNGISAFIPQEKYSIMDDHIPFIEKGIHMIDIIDFDYPYWHTLQDTPDKCSKESLEAVGRVLLIFVYSQQ